MPSLYILPFDHRGSFQKMLFPETKELTEEQKNTIRKYKRVIFNSMLSIGKKRGGYEDLAILVDEEYGAEIHRDCKKLGIRNILTMEKSGQKIFDFEYENWKEHLKTFQPAFAKALIRVVMGGVARTAVPIGEDHGVQNARLMELQNFCEGEGIGLLIEPLIEPSEADLQTCGGEKKRFDLELRPKRFEEAVKEMHAAGVKPDVWKIEGTETKEAMQVCSEAAFNGGKSGVQIVILGRGATQAEVDRWLSTSATVKGVNGFAIGRTAFSDAISKLHQGKINEQQATDEIAKNYQHCIEVFEKAKA